MSENKYKLDGLQGTRLLKIQVRINYDHNMCDLMRKKSHITRYARQNELEPWRRLRITRLRWRGRTEAFCTFRRHFPDDFPLLPLVLPVEEAVAAEDEAVELGFDDEEGEEDEESPPSPPDTNAAIGGPGNWYFAAVIPLKI